MLNSRLHKLLEMLQSQPDDAFLIYAVGFEYEAAGVDASAREYYDKLLADHSAYLPTYYQAGLLYHKIGDFEKGISLLNQGIELAKVQNDKKTLRELTQALEEMEDE